MGSTRKSGHSGRKWLSSGNSLYLSVILRTFLGWDVRVPGNLAGIRMSVCLSLTVRFIDPQVNLEAKETTASPSQ